MPPCIFSSVEWSKYHEQTRYSKELEQFRVANAFN